MGFLSVSQISKTFGDRPVVNAVDLSVERGAFFSLLGPSGCGKSTLLRMIAGFETPDLGTITIDGQLMNDVPPNLRPTNMVFQSYAIFPHLNVFDNIAYGLRKSGFSKEDLRRKVEAMLATVRLEGLGNRASDQLSVASASAWRWPAPWCANPKCCCWTNRWAHWTSGCAKPCSSNSGPFSARSASPSCWSPTIRKKRCRCRTGWQ
jgi:ABC-type lipopolysaccharide export system ATPase subunit